MWETSRHTRAVFVASICLAPLVVAPGIVAADDIERDSLKGLPGVQVVVEQLEADVEQHGLTAAAIKTDVELRLRRSGIRVFSDLREDPSPAKAYVYVNINIKEAGSGGLYAVSVSVALNQWLRSQTSGLETPGTTWHRSLVATVGDVTVRQVRDPVNDYVDEFINDFLAANPKRQ